MKSWGKFSDHSALENRDVILAKRDCAQREQSAISPL